MSDGRGEETPATYSLRVGIRAFRDRGTLATNPRRYAVPDDATGFAQEVRAITFRRDVGTAPYRLIYRVTEEGDDGPLVGLLHIRHGAARQMTKKEAREIEAQNRE